MAWIKTIAPNDATGMLGRVYESARKRAGKVFNILRLQSLRPEVLSSSTRLYAELMHATRGGLTRVQREMIATVVSRANNCHY